MCCHRDSKSSKLMMKINHHTYCVYLLLTPPSKFSWWNPSFQEYLHHRNVQSLRPGPCFCSASWVVNTSLLSPNVPPSLVWPHGGHHCIIYSCVSVCIDYIKIIRFFMCTHVCVHLHTICEGPLTCVAWWRLKVNTMYQSRSLSTLFSRLNFSLNLKFTILVKPADHWAPEIHASLPSNTRIKMCIAMPGCYTGAEELNSGLNFLLSQQHPQNTSYTISILVSVSSFQMISN